MPTYDYKCKKCGKEFSTMMTITEHDKAKPTCPGCGSKSVKQLFSPFSAITSKKS